MKQNTNLYFFILLLCTFSFANLFAQESNRKSPLTYTNIWGIDRNINEQYLDTNMNETEIFHPMYQKNILFQDMGNIGSAGKSAVFNLQQPVGFNASFNPYQNYMFSNNDIRFYNTTAPITELFYSQGAQELLFLKAMHSQNILPRWNVGIDFSRITSEGFLLRQKAGHYNTQVTTNYHSKNKRYQILAALTFNNGILQENGGITSDSSFEALSGSNKAVNVNLNLSENNYHNRSAIIKQYYKFGNATQVINGEDTLYGFEPKSQFSHTFKAEETSYIFNNSGDSINTLLPNQFYSNVSGVTYDSVYNGKIENSINYNWLNNNISNKRSFINFGLTHQAIVISQPTYINYYNNVIAKTQLEKVNNNHNSLSYLLDAAYVITGFNQNNYNLKGTIIYNIKPIDFTFAIAQQQYTPDYNMLRFESNQFIWNNNFKSSHSFSQHFAIKTKMFRNNFNIAINHYLISNHTYLNYNLMAEQANGNASVFHIEFGKTFQLGKFYFNHILHYQNSTESYIPLPKFGGRVRYYFETNFYTSKIQLGVNVYYNSSYYGMAWSPATRMFYLQNQTQIGNYFLVNPFISMQIKRAVLFAQFEHANQNLINKGFYNTPHYPISLQSFRIGVTWRMYN